ncbi:trichodiene synthase [Xylariaceae sp. FL0255]|nr:trichodiene synthase [Xylariaceae sp. FL0255]
METQEFPREYFVGTIVRLLDTMKYDDTNYSDESRVRNLRYAYGEAARHFAQPHVQSLIKMHPKKVEGGLRTIACLVVYCWVNASPELMAALTIYFMYTLILDDSERDLNTTMQTFFEDLKEGREQKDPWLKLMSDHLPQVLQHYGPFCSLNIYRSTMDFFEGCWIEQQNFGGYPGSTDYPEFLRRMNGLGHVVGASLFPTEMFNEQEHMCEITTALSMVENWMAWANDLVSYYKERDDPKDDATSLVNNYCQVGSLTTEQSLEKLTNNTLRVSGEIVNVFSTASTEHDQASGGAKDKDPLVGEILTRFMHGYITWHLCDPRYRIDEIYEQIQGCNDETSRKFCRYFEQANKVGRVDPARWANPTYLQLAAETLEVTDNRESRDWMSLLPIKPHVPKNTQVPQAIVTTFLVSTSAMFALYLK